MSDSKPEDQKDEAVEPDAPTYPQWGYTYRAGYYYATASNVSLTLMCQYDGGVTDGKG